jgi:hypothetical protein
VGIKIPLDFSAVEEFEALDGGVYSAVLEQMFWHEQKENQKADQIEVKYTITEDDESKGTKISQFLSFSSKALFRMRDFFEVFDADIDEIELDEVEDGKALIVSPDLSGTPVEIKITKEKHYQDKDRWVNKVNAPPRLIETKRKKRAARDEDEDEEVERPAKRSSSSRSGGRSIR